MKLLLLSIAIVLSITGCVDKTGVSPNGKCKDVHYTKTICPKFTGFIYIDIIDLNSTHAAISWKDVGKIEILLKQKKRFNSSVASINSGN